MDRFSNVLLFNMCMIVDEEANKVLVQDKKDEEWGGITFPGGHVENAESIIASTIREVKEETGLIIKNLKKCGLIHWYNSDNNKRWFIFLFKTKDFVGELINETEEGKVFWVDINELPKMNLAPDFSVYLKLFFDENLNEAYGTWNSESSNELTIL